MAEKIRESLVKCMSTKAQLGDKIDEQLRFAGADRDSLRDFQESIRGRN
jgi:hypothetical protein